jgi:hypothetical protein
MDKAECFFNVPITKAEKLEDGRVHVSGIGFIEKPDKVKEVIDYDSVVACMDAYSGNLREMHKPEAVGKVLAWEPVEVEGCRAIKLDGFISEGAPLTQAKVLDGTLSQFSIGGASDKTRNKVVWKVDGKDVNATKVVLERISEWSIVDSGMVPGCRFDVKKGEFVDPEPPGPSWQEQANAAFVAKAEVLGIVLKVNDVQKVNFAETNWAYPTEEVGDVLNALYAVNIIAWLEQHEKSEGHPEAAVQAELLHSALENLSGFIASEVKEILSPKMAEVLKADLGADKATTEEAATETPKTTDDASPNPGEGGNVAKVEGLADVVKAEVEKMVGGLVTKLDAVEGENKVLKAEIEQMGKRIVSEPGHPLYRDSHGNPTTIPPEKQEDVTKADRSVFTASEVEAITARHGNDPVRFQAAVNALAAEKMILAAQPKTKRR